MSDNFNTHRERHDFNAWRRFCVSNVTLWHRTKISIGKVRFFTGLIVLMVLCSCSKAGSSLDTIEDMMIKEPEMALDSLSDMDTLSMSENKKARRALLEAYIATVHVVPIDMTPNDLIRATTAFDGKCSPEEVKSLIIKSEFAKLRGDHVARLELLKDAEFLAIQLDDNSDLGFIYLYLSKVYANGFKIGRAHV